MLLDSLACPGSGVAAKTKDKRSRGETKEPDVCAPGNVFHKSRSRLVFLRVSFVWEFELAKERRKRCDTERDGFLYARREFQGFGSLPNWSKSSCVLDS